MNGDQHNSQLLQGMASFVIRGPQDCLRAVESASALLNHIVRYKMSVVDEKHAFAVRLSNNLRWQSDFKLCFQVEQCGDSLLSSLRNIMNIPARRTMMPQEPPPHHQVHQPLPPQQEPQPREIPMSPPRPFQESPERPQGSPLSPPAYENGGPPSPKSPMGAPEPPRFEVPMPEEGLPLELDL